MRRRIADLFCCAEGPLFAGQVLVALLHFVIIAFELEALEWV